MNSKAFAFSILIIFVMTLLAKPANADDQVMPSEGDSLAKSAERDEDDRDASKANSNSKSRFEVYMSIDGMGEGNDIIGNFLNLQRYNLKQSINLSHRNMKNHKADIRAKRFWIIGIFRDPLKIAPADIPWPIQSDVQLDNDFHTVTPLIGF